MDDTTNTLHPHPQDTKKTIFGRALQTGEVLQKGDMYGSSTGKWEPVPKQLLGNEIHEGHGAILIRPAPHEATGRIRIIKIPHGEAPDEIRQKWVGCVLPCCPYFGHFGKGRQHGVLTGVASERDWYAFAVPQDQAIAALEQHNPDAATWWKAHGFPRLGMYFCFDEDEAEIVSGVTRQKITVYDNMEAGSWRPVLTH